MVETMVQVDAQAKRAFDADGHWLGPKLFENDRLEDLAYAQDEVFAGRYETGRDPVARYWNPGDDPYSLHKVDNSHWSNPILAQAVLDERIGRMAAELLDAPTVRLWHEQILMKPVGGHETANVAWHQDYNYWRSSDKPLMLTAWVPLQDVNPHVGTICFLSGSHKWGWHEQYSHFGKFDMEEQETLIRRQMPEEAEYKAAPIAIEAGRVNFHHCLTLHGSGPNLARRQNRRAIAIHIQADDCRLQQTNDSADNHTCAQEMRRLGKASGDKFEGKSWPVLWSAG